VSKRSGRVVVAGGGTGGHLYPGIAVVEALEEREPELEFAFVGTEGGLEARVIPETDWAFHAVEVPPLQGRGIRGVVEEGWTLTKSGLQAMGLVRELDPVLTIGVGGYAAGPFTLASALTGRPTVVLEQNREPGMTNRILDRFVDAAFVSFEETCEHLAIERCRAYGNPVRRAIREGARSYEYEAPEEEETFRILVTGGSGGARSLNERFPRALCRLDDETERGLEVRHQFGEGRRDEVEGRYASFTGEVELVEFIDEMAEAYRRCDLFVGRAGGTTIAEVLAFGMAAVLVPSPNVTERQQHKNVRAIAEAGAGIMLSDEEIGEPRATRLLKGLLDNPVSLENLARRARQMGGSDAAESIATDCLDLIEGL